MTDPSSGAASKGTAHAQGVVLLIVAIFGWGLTWPVNKVLLESLSPFWLAAIRSALSTLVLLAVAIPGGRLVLPPRSDLPVLLSITLLHMVGFSIFAAIGLKLVPVGRSVVLAYTTPLWVTPGAALFLGEQLSLRRAGGVALGLLGLVVLFNPLAFNWHDHDAVLGNMLLLLAALLWAGSILHIRGHRWRSTPFQLVPWEMLLATAILFVIALVSDAAPDIVWTAPLAGLLLLTSVLGSTITYWAIAMAGRRLSAVTISLGLLGAPVIGIVTATLALGEAPDLFVWLAIALIASGVALATSHRNTRP
jgi:drug/metabolite transporter (DMT)-like permease